MSAGRTRTQVRTTESGLHALAAQDWDFRDSKTSYLTHGLHPYPAKFIPQIPRAIVQALSRPGDIVADIFCGSGTTLVEAMLLGRHAIGVDANPLACLISQAKTLHLSSADFVALDDLGSRLEAALPGSLFATMGHLPDPQIPESEAIRFWFDPHVAMELGIVRALLEELPHRARILAKVSFSSIIVVVSKQDSDTRYVRREKNTQPGETTRRFLRALRSAVAAATQFALTVDPGLTSRVLSADVLSAPDIGQVDLVVSSPPYPNAYSYHLYHMTRMIWLGFDQPTFKLQEIGSHRKYSSKGPNCATAETFRSELEIVFAWLHQHLRAGGFACFVIGDSILKGKVIQNDELMVSVAADHGFTLRENFNRRLQDTRKAFNPKIGKIKDEHVIFLQSSKKAT